jgi:hypothetical protein
MAKEAPAGSCTRLFVLVEDRSAVGDVGEVRISLSRQ